MSASRPPTAASNRGRLENIRRQRAHENLYAAAPPNSGLIHFASTRRRLARWLARRQRRRLVVVVIAELAIWQNRAGAAVAESGITYLRPPPTAELGCRPLGLTMNTNRSHRPTRRDASGAARIHQSAVDEDGASSVGGGGSDERRAAFAGERASFTRASSSARAQLVNQKYFTHLNEDGSSSAHCMRAPPQRGPAR